MSERRIIHQSECGDAQGWSFVDAGDPYVTVTEPTFVARFHIDATLETAATGLPELATPS